MFDIDQKFITRLSMSSLDIQDKGNGLYNIRCPRCGDSKKSKYKKRGYFVPRRDIDKYLYTCFNCGDSITFATFLKDYDDALFREYRLEHFVSNKSTKWEEKISDPVDGQKWLDQLPLLQEKISAHPGRVYCQNRKIPMDKVYYTDDWVAWAKQFAPEKFKPDKIYGKDQAIVFALRVKSHVIGFQARMIAEGDKRYQTILLDRNHMAVFGLDTVDCNRKYYVTEGIVDALHLPNSLAVLSNQVTSTLSQLHIPTENAVICLDNEKFNKDTVQQYHKAIENGLKVFIWPESIQWLCQGAGHKDFNDLANGGMSNQQIKELIDQNTFRGLDATLRFNVWKKG